MEATAQHPSCQGYSSSCCILSTMEAGAELSVLYHPSRDQLTIGGKLIILDHLTQKEAETCAYCPQCLCQYLDPRSRSTPVYQHGNLHNIIRPKQPPYSEVMMMVTPPLDLLIRSYNVSPGNFWNGLIKA